MRTALSSNEKANTELYTASLPAPLPFWATNLAQLKASKKALMTAEKKALTMAHY